MEGYWINKRDKCIPIYIFILLPKFRSDIETKSIINARLIIFQVNFTKHMLIFSVRIVLFKRVSIFYLTPSGISEIINFLREADCIVQSPFMRKFHNNLRDIPSIY